MNKDKAKTIMRSINNSIGVFFIFKSNMSKSIQEENESNIRKEIDNLCKEIGYTRYNKYIGELEVEYLRDAIKFYLGYKEE